VIIILFYRNYANFTNKFLQYAVLYTAILNFEKDREIFSGDREMFTVPGKSIDFKK